jgi:hypothetical protein
MGQDTSKERGSLSMGPSLDSPRTTGHVVPRKFWPLFARLLIERISGPRVRIVMAVPFQRWQREDLFGESRGERQDAAEAWLADIWSNQCDSRWGRHRNRTRQNPFAQATEGRPTGKRDALDLVALLDLQPDSTSHYFSNELSCLRDVLVKHQAPGFNAFVEACQNLIYRAGGAYAP